jgi:broad specificity phosphatase PhoE
MDHLNLARGGPRVPTRVIFVRHGNVHNPKNLIYGRLPRMRLSQRGQDEIDRTGRFLADRGVSTIYTSPLLRARQSAAILASYCHVPVRVVSWLAEVQTSWEGEDNKVVSQIRGFSYYDPLKAEGDETIHDVFTRMNRTLRLVLRRHPGETTVCVSHGDPIKILRVGYSGKPLTPDHVRAPDPGQASLVTFDFWDPDALPVLSALDLNRAEQLIHATGLTEPEPESATETSGRRGTRARRPGV